MLVSQHTDVRHDRSLSVLIVEDEPTSRAALSMLLAAYGYRTFPVASGEEALSLLSSEPDARDGHAVVAIIDVDLPGMNGVELMERLRAQDPSFPAVFVTAAARERMNDLANRGVPLLRKPLDFRHLLTILSEQQAH